MQAKTTTVSAKAPTISAKAARGRGKTGRKGRKLTAEQRVAAAAYLTG